MKRLSKIAESYIYDYLLALVLLMPLHAFVVVSLGHMLGHQALLQAWKEAGLVVGAIAASLLILTRKQSRGQLILQPAVWSASAFCLLALIISATQHRVNFASFLLGAKTTLGFLVVFIIIQTAQFSRNRWNVLIKSLLTISSAVGIFAVAQVYLLPADWLTRFGYGAATILPFHLVDPAVSSIRIIATFSGPNQLGSFMVIPFILSLWLLLRKQWPAAVSLALTGFALFHSYSRSAWIGALLASFIVVFIRLKGWWKLSLIVPVLALYIVASSLSGPVRTMSTKLTFYVFHGQFIDGHTNGSDSNRLANARYGLTRIQQQPIGYGLGTAGPASKNTSQPIITENSYLQIAIEAGVIGLSLFVLTLGLSLIALRRHFAIVEESAALFAMLIGLCATNLFLHTWSDSATALVLWGLMGYCLTAPLKERA